MSTVYEMVSFSVAHDEGQPFWNATFEFAKVEDVLSLKVNDRITLNILGELFEFYVDEITLNKTGPTSIDASVHAVGLGANLDIPRKAAYTNTWKEDAQAEDIVNELLEGRVTSWDIVDWTIIGNRLSVESGSRVSTAQTVVQAAGGVLEGTPDGDFIVRKLFPVSPKDLVDATPDFIFDEVTDLYSTNENYQNSRYVDWVRVRDSQQSGIQDFTETEFDENNNLAATIYVYPMPWRAVHVETTGGSTISLNLIGEQEREEEEIIAIVEGVGTSRYPILEILDIEWQAVNLTSLYFDQYTRTVYSSHSTLKYSLAKVKYKTKAIVYRTTSEDTREVQYLVYDDT